MKINVENAIMCKFESNDIKKLQILLHSSILMDFVIEIGDEMK